MIHGTGIGFQYDYDTAPAIRDINISVAPGELLAVLGCNGCGKSTLVKHFNALLPLQRGELRVADMDVADENNKWRLRRKCGMVFQNPDNQFVSSLVEEDIAFGLENYGVPREQIQERVAEALSLVGMQGYEKRSPHSLSGGQKQRIALAGVLALEPEILVFDEVTAMLDPDGRAQVLESIQSLHRAGRTIVMITHYVEETIDADKILLMADGKALALGTPREVLTNRQLMASAGLLPPTAVELYYDLQDRGISLGRCPLTEKELVREICQLNCKA